MDFSGISFATLGMFIIDEFSFTDENGQPDGRALQPQIGGGGTYAAIGARIWLPPNQIGMIVDRGFDFPPSVHQTLLAYGEEMWMFRQQPTHPTTRALNSYRGDHRGFQYQTQRIRITPKDFVGTKLDRPKVLHFICSPSRALAIMAEVSGRWQPTTIYEPIPDRCLPEELPSLKQVVPSVTVLSPNAEEALSLLSHTGPVSRDSIEWAASQLLSFGIGKEGSGWVIIRSGGLGAYLKSSATQGTWIDAYWTVNDVHRVVDVTGAGNSFLGGLAAGILLSRGDMHEATLYATISASYVIEQEGLPTISVDVPECWNDDQPQGRLQVLRERHGIRKN